VKKIAVLGAGIVGICSAYFLQKSGFSTTIIDREKPGTMTSFGHACTFADYANIPVNSPSIFKDLPSMLFKKDSPLSIDFFYAIKNLPWLFKFLKNCRKDKVEEISLSLANILKHASLSYDQIFEDVNVSQYIKNEENIYLFHNKRALEDYNYATSLRKKNNIEVQNLSKNEVLELEPNLSPVFYSGQLFIGSRHTTNPLAISSKIFKKFLSQGGKYIQKNVNNVFQKENSVEIILEQNKYEFDEIIICAGAWSNLIANMVGEDFPLDTERGYHVLFETDKQLINRPIAWSESGFYLIQIEDGIRAAGTVEIANLNKPPNDERTKMIERQSRKILPELGNVKSTWMGRRPTLPDALPIIGRSEKNKNVFFAFGHQHIGWTLAAVTGKIIKDLVKDIQPNINIDAFNPYRF
tara:strand:+ start:40 stop:1269 length:1230 start_codon:yes stop_codon:yes gene_type:complete